MFALTLNSLIKCFFLSTCLVYAYVHSIYLNTETHFDIIHRSLWGILLSTFICCVLEYFFQSFFILIGVGAVTLIYSICFKQGLQNSLITTIFSIGLSFCIRVPSAALLAAILTTTTLNPTSVLYQFILFIIHFLLLILFFRIPRFSHGISFINDPRYTDIALFASIVILFIIALLQIESASMPINLILSASLLIFAFLVFVWIKRSTKRKYIDILEKQERESFRKEIQHLQEEKSKLIEDNKRLASIIHKDNKLMNAMLLAVQNLDRVVIQEGNPQKREKKCRQILDSLYESAEDRAEVIRNYDYSGHQLPETNCDRIDGLLSFIDKKAFSEKISFEATVIPGFMSAVSRTVSTKDLETLLADLLENAIIATKKQEKRSILLSLDLEEGKTVISIYDSGIPFPPEVKAAWGIRRVTTHAGDGGSGIGMMSTCELCRKYGAQFQIREFEPGMLFTKCVSVTFPACGPVSENAVLPEPPGSVRSAV